LNQVGILTLLTEVELRLLIDSHVSLALEFIRVTDLAKFHIARAKALFDSSLPPSEPSGVADWALVGGRAGGGS